MQLLLYSVQHTDATWGSIEGLKWRRRLRDSEGSLRSTLLMVPKQKDNIISDNF